MRFIEKLVNCGCLANRIIVNDLHYLLSFVMGHFLCVTGVGYWLVFIVLKANVSQSATENVEVAQLVAYDVDVGSDSPEWGRFSFAITSNDVTSS